eukprot:GEZU01027091.1.p1 GENE.GEZU01027091.1~~GEZU01027091.1.p1  ORF type:complete len:552 (-),score=145.16 GEZU01027091.1:61-1716(-)
MSDQHQQEDQSVSTTTTTETTAVSQEETEEMREIKKHIQNLVTELSNSATSDARKAAIADQLADLCREESNRSPFGDAGAIPLLVGLLKTDNEECHRAAARAIGNLCFDHVENRKRVDEAGGVEPLVSVLRNSVNPVVEKTVAGAIGNVIVDVDEIQQKVINLGGIEICVEKLSRTDDEMVKYMCIKVIDNFSVSRSMNQLMIQKGILKPLLRVAADTEEGDEADNNELQLTQSADEAFSVLISLVEDDKLKPLFRTEGCLPIILDLAVSSSCLETKKRATKLLSQLVLDDENMVQLYQMGALDSFLRFSKSQDPELRISGTMALGNLARNEEHCLEMVNRGVAQHLVQMLDVEAQKGKEADFKLLQLILGALKNLAIPEANKKKLAEIGVIPAVVPWLQHDNDAIQFYALSALRLLVKGNPDNAHKVIAEGALERIIKHSMSPMSHVHIEATRTLVLFIEYSDAIRRQLVTEGGLRVFFELLGSEHASLRTEALKALASLVEIEDTRSKFVEDGGKEGIEKVVRLANAEDTSAEAKQYAEKVVRALTEKG